jgi:hypothetical protein
MLEAAYRGPHPIISLGRSHRRCKAGSRPADYPIFRNKKEPRFSEAVVPYRKSSLSNTSEAVSG